MATPELELAQALRQARQTQGLSLRELARRLHRSHSNLWDYERGHRVATREIVQDYERVLRLPLRSLLNLWQAAEDAAGEARKGRRSDEHDRAMPSGTVTFLLTDIVGSTRLWEAHPLEMEQALETHDKIIETAVTRAGGSLLKMRGEGDSTFSVFSRATDALTGATDAQNNLGAEVWPSGLQPAVRMALHTGEPIERAGDFYGSTVNRAARLRSLAKGGQIVVSGSTTALLGHRVPAPWILADLGEHRLDGFDHPEHVWALELESARGVVTTVPAVTEPATPRRPPAARRVVTGRRRELATLQRWVAEMYGGRPRAVLIGGDAGIGKSTIAAECCRLAEGRGATVLAGRCHQDVSVPYLPWASALMPLSDDSGPVMRGDRDLGPLLSLLQAEPESRPELALYVALVRTLLAAARSRPTLVLLEDVQWADQASLNLLTHAVAALSHEGTQQPTTLMFVLTYRTPIVEDRVERTLARYRVEPVCAEINLEGLDPLALNEVLAECGPFPPSPALLQDIADASGGNPLLATSLLRRLWHDGHLTVERGRLTGRSDGDAVVPRRADLQHELRARVDDVSGPCRQLLETASVLGDGRPLAELVALSGATQEDVEPLIDEAIAAQLLSDDGECYRFEHPQVRAVCAATLSQRRRQQLHHRIALALIDRHGERAAGVAPTIAYHLARSGKDAADDLLASYGVLAGDQAFAMAAYGDAASYYEAALTAGAAQSDPARLCRLHHQAGTAHFRNHDIPAAVAQEEQALALAESLGDLELWGHAAVTLGKCRVAHGAPLGSPLADLAPLHRFLEAAGPRLPHVRAEVLAEMAEAHYVALDFESGLRVANQARALVRQDGVDGAGCSVEAATGLQYLAMLDIDEAEACFGRSATHARRLGDHWMEAWGVSRLPLVHWMRGDLVRAEQGAKTACALASANQDFAEHSLASACWAGLAASCGRFEEAEEHAAQAHLMQLRSDYSFSPMLYCLALAHARTCRGDREGARQAIDQWREVGGRGLGRWLVLIDALIGGPDEVAPALAARPWGAAGLDGPNLFTLPLTGAAVEVADAIDDIPRLQAAAGVLAAAERRRIRWSAGWPHFIPRLSGVIALRLGRLDESVRRLEEARVLAEGMGSMTEDARSRLDLARALVARDGAGDRSRATDLAGSAADALASLDVAPLAARARVLFRL